MTNFGAYMNLYKPTNYRGTPAAFRGATQNDALADYPGGSWDDCVNSLTTGESAWAELYEKPDFGGKVLRVGPNTTICNLSEVSIENRKFNNTISSVKLFDARPQYWPGSSVSTRRYFTMSDVRRYSINKSAKSLTESVLEMIPEVGSVLSGIVSALWPFGPDRADVWNDMNAWVLQQIEDLVQKLAGHLAENDLRGLANLIIQCQTAKSESSFTALYSRLLVLEPRFDNPVDPASVLPQITLFGTIALAVYRLAYFNYEAIYISTPSAADKEQKLKTLTQAISALRGAVARGYGDARERRLKKITNREYKNVWGLFGGGFDVKDDYIGWSKTFKHNGSEDSKGHADFQSNRAFDYLRVTAAQNFDAEFDVYREVADLWTHFDQAAKPELRREWRQVAMGVWGGFDGPVPQNQHGGGGHRDYSVRLERGKKVTSVTLYAEKDGGNVEGFAFDVDGKPATVGGDFNSPVELWGKKGKASTGKIAVADSERITGVFGAWGDHLNNVTIRKQAFGGDGEASAWPAETGLGKDGGQSYSMSGSDGADGVLSGFFCQLDNFDGKLVALGTYWSHDRVLPRT